MYFSVQFLDKICDQVSDAVLDAHLAQDPNAKVACGMILVNCRISKVTSYTKIGEAADQHWLGIKSGCGYGAERIDGWY